MLDYIVDELDAIAATVGIAMLFNDYLFHIQSEESGNFFSRFSFVSAGKSRENIL